MSELHNPVNLTLDSPLEALRLSRLARNTLRRGGCTSIRCTLEVASGRRYVRRFGVITGREVARALVESGFVLPGEHK